MTFQQSREDHNFAALSNGGLNNQQYESLPQPYEVEIPITIDAPSSCQSHFNLKMNNADNYVPYILDINDEKGKLEAPKCAYGTARNLKTEDCLTVSLCLLLPKNLISQRVLYFIQGFTGYLLVLNCENCCLMAFQNILQREIASQLGGKLMQLLMNNSVELPKFSSRGRYHFTASFMCSLS